MTRKKENKNRPLYMISVVSRILEVHPQTLRMYEREGFVCPHRINQQRLYSEEDVERLNLVIKLTKEMGVNKAGVDIILRMRSRMEAMQSEIREMMRFIEDDIRQDFEDRLRKIFSED
ncbi:MAG: MerR family transcriptional regulator [Nitrospirae bacterium GWC2_46_6]|nr:MAG: MerR family transcriptional regulator [Nitrospirae bacterium GWC2_46_6]OGW22602.1 MAG: MerR family transcriptional regulator [Nitrospirae bacterium GWA2_46_11]OGW24010.1 MAG: MerR family transcriptional regulator [Nitrospirae bacterium GWB2_47_37]HAK88839.1 MerR family transcriptional regulator [Nitrospiraceae bacterium]HCL81268.1 MerR family transcriptional regulator [Nitrospiraceae bacterium]